MASGKQRKRKASRRVLVVAAALVVLVVVAVSLGAALSRGSSTTVAPGSAGVQRLLHGIPQQGNVLGSRSAPVTLVEYIDLQCPYCQQFETQAMPSLVARFVRSGKLKIVARPIAFIGPDSQRGRLAAVAAGKQGKFFNLVQVLYLNQGAENSGWLSDHMVDSAAAGIPGLNVSRLLADETSHAVTVQAGAYDRQATKDRVQATPTILVGKSGGHLRAVILKSPADAQSVASAINAALRK
jgi:protein-disulfide isomerase